MWDPSTIAGLEWVNQTDFEYRTNQIALAGTGGLGESGTEGDFAYDDTAWGKVPDGLFRTLATCAVNPYPPPDGTWYSGEYVQLQLGFVNQLGRDYSTLGATGTNGGAITALHVSMAGYGALSIANEDDGSDLVASLPYTTAGRFGHLDYLLRPASLPALHWPGQDDNQAVRTIWRQSEVHGPVAITFGVVSNSVEAEMQFYATGWKAPVGSSTAPPTTPTTVKGTGASTGNVRHSR